MCCRRHYQNPGHIGWRRVLSPALTNAPPFLPNRANYRSFSHDVTAAIFVYKTMNLRPCLCTKNPVGIELFSHVKTFFYSKQFAKLPRLKTIYTQQLLSKQGGILQFVPSPSQLNKFLETAFLYNYENLKIASGVDSSSNNRDNRTNIIRCISSHMVTHVFLMPPNKNLLFRSLTQSRFSIQQVQTNDTIALL